MLPPVCLTNVLHKPSRLPKLAHSCTDLSKALYAYGRKKKKKRNHICVCLCLRAERVPTASRQKKRGVLNLSTKALRQYPHFSASSSPFVFQKLSLALLSRSLALLRRRCSEEAQGGSAGKGTACASLYTFQPVTTVLFRPH